MLSKVLEWVWPVLPELLPQTLALLKMTQCDKLQLNSEHWCESSSAAAHWITSTGYIHLMSGSSAHCRWLWPGIMALECTEVLTVMKVNLSHYDFNPTVFFNDSPPWNELQQQHLVRNTKEGQNLNNNNGKYNNLILDSSVTI